MLEDAKTAPRSKSSSFRVPKTLKKCVLEDSDPGDQGHENDKNEASDPAVKNPPVLEESESEDMLPEVKVKRNLSRPSN